MRLARRVNRFRLDDGRTLKITSGGEYEVWEDGDMIAYGNDVAGWLVSVFETQQTATTARAFLDCP